MSPEVKNYFQFCSLYGLEQLIQSPTRVTCSTSSLIDHKLTTFPKRVSQQGIIDVGLPDHQLIYCTRKFSRNKVGTVKQITFCSLKKLITAEAYKEALGKVCFPDYENFSDVNKAYENFIQKFMRPKKKVVLFLEIAWAKIILLPTSLHMLNVYENIYIFCFKKHTQIKKSSLANLLVPINVFFCSNNER